MANLNRFAGNVVPFASNSTGTNRTIFNNVTQSDDIDDNLNADFKLGWEIVGVSEVPTKQDFNAFGYTNSLLTAYLFQKGVAEWQTLQEFHTNGITVGTDGVGYQSTINSNIGNNPTLATDTSQWRIAINPYQDQQVTHNISSDADYTLTSLQNKYGRITITDTGVVLTTGRNIITDNMPRVFTVVNSTSQTLTVKTSAGTGIEVSAGNVNTVYNDGINIVEYSPTKDGVMTTNNFLHIQDQRTSGTNAGNSVAGEQTRVLNTVLTNNISGASLSANQITLPAGTYYVEASAPSKLRNHQVYLDNVTDVTRTIVGESVGNNLQDVVTRSSLSGIFTIASAKVFELVHFISNNDSNGLGLAIGNAIEVYSDIKIWKVG